MNTNRHELRSIVIGSIVLVVIFVVSGVACQVRASDDIFDLMPFPFFYNIHFYEFAGDSLAVEILVEVWDHFEGDTTQFWWVYTVTNHSYDPIPLSTNGFSGFILNLLMYTEPINNIQSPSAAWEFQWDPESALAQWTVSNSSEAGIMPGESGVFSFTTWPVELATGDGEFYTWENDIPAFIVDFTDAGGIEVPGGLPLGIDFKRVWACFAASCIRIANIAANYAPDINNIVESCGLCFNSTAETSSWGAIKQMYRK